MAIAYDAAVGTTGTTTPTTGSLNHAALVAVIINITYIGTTSPNAVTVGGTAATYVTGSKVSYSTNNSTEAWYMYRASAANETVSVGFASSPRVAWNAVSYTGATLSFENVATGNNTGSSPTTSTVTPAAGTPGRMLICGVGVGNSANATGSITITVNRTQRDSTRALSGSSSTKAVSAATEEYSDNSGSAALTSTDTKSSSTLDWATWAIGLKGSFYDDMATRFKLWAQNCKDPAARFKLTVQNYKDAAARFVMNARTFNDEGTRFKLAFPSDAWKDVGTRFKMVVQGYCDV